MWNIYVRLVSLLVLSIVLLSPIDNTVQGVIAVLAVLAFVLGFAFGLGAGKRNSKHNHMIVSFSFFLFCVNNLVIFLPVLLYDLCF